MDLPTLDQLTPFLVLGFALGGVFAMSGVGLVVLYRATGVLNLAYGAICATGALISWQLLDSTGVNEWLALSVCIIFAGLSTLVYGVALGPPLAARDPLTKATATLGLLVILLGAMQWIWGRDPHAITLPTSRTSYTFGDVRISWTQIIGIVFPIVVTVGTAYFLRASKIGTAMRALANDREITATLGVPVRRVEAAAWLGSGVLCGIAGLLLSNLVSLDIIGLSFIVIPALAAALIGRLRSLWMTLLGGFAIGILQSSATAFPDLAQYRQATPFVLAIVTLLYFAGRRQITEGRMS
jgi:branched-chain amino acid transport system permease protein